MKMSSALLAIPIAIPILGFSLECEIQLENQTVRVLKISLDPKEEVGFHRDVCPRIMHCNLACSLLQTFEDGRQKVIDFSSDQAVYLPSDPIGVMHKTANLTDAKLEFIVVELK